MMGDCSLDMTNGESYFFFLYCFDITIVVFLSISNIVPSLAVFLPTFLPFLVIIIFLCESISVFSFFHQKLQKLKVVLLFVHCLFSTFCVIAEVRFIVPKSHFLLQNNIDFVFFSFNIISFAII